MIKPSFYNLLFRSNNNHHIKKWIVSLSQKFYLNQRLKFQYPDMTIYTSRNAMIKIFNNLNKPGQFDIIETNVNMTSNKELLNRNTLRLLSKPNAGGSSIYSEAISIEILSRLLGVHLYKSETELKYKYIEQHNNGGSGPLLDYACHYLCPNQNELLTLGVSVTRAMTWKSKSLTSNDAYRLLNKKIFSLIKSSQSIINVKFDRHILHIWTESGKNSNLIKKVCKKLYEKYEFNDMIVLISIINNDLIFFNNNHHLLLIK